MANSTNIKFLCAIIPSHSHKLTAYDILPAWMCYQAGNGPTLYRNASPERIQGGILMVSDSALQQITSPARFCQQAARECVARSAEGLCANWSRRPTDTMRTFTSALDSACAGQGLSLWVPEAYGDCCESASVLISSALSGGTLRQRLEEAVQHYGAERVTLAVERMRMDFSLPSPTGEGRALSPDELTALQEKFHPELYPSPELCAEYFTYSIEGQTHFVLFDTPESLSWKVALARELGIGAVMTAWQEVEDCADLIFPKKIRSE